MAKPIQLYSLGTPNGQKVSIALEEMGLAYDAHLVDISKGDQFKPEFLKINPNNKIPAIVDLDGPDGQPINVFESGAILVYLAEKSKQFLPEDPRLRTETLQWLFFQMGGIGPMFGQFGHFFKYAKDKCDHPYPLERYTNEAKRLLLVLEKRLEGRHYLVGETYTIADMATVPWILCLSEFYKGETVLGLDQYKNVEAWVKRICERPKTKAGLRVLGD